MRFKGNYAGKEGLNLGTFFSSDIRKLVSLRQYYPYMIPDGVDDPLKTYTEKVRAENTLYFIGKKEKKVMGYGALDPIMQRDAIAHFWARRKRFRKEDWLGIARLVLGYGFEHLGLVRVTITFPPSLVGFEKVIKQMGFSREGLLRKSIQYDGELHDLAIYGILKEEF